jgi:NAD(P)-dependent dehydrogenase (short-subunit alcohol dehydrogenase family)
MFVVITGASQGIGAAIAEAFAAEPDCRLGLLARRHDRLEAVATRCRSQGAAAECFVCDVTRTDDVARVADDLLGHGVPDVVVNNAGRFEPGSVLDTSAEQFRAQLEVNLVSAFLVTRAFLPSMRRAGQGHLFYLGSVASLQAYPGGAAYCAAKHGLLGLARAVREETRDCGIRDTTLLPGATWTPSWEGAPVPEDRMMPATDLGRTVVELHRLSTRSVAEEIVLRPQRGDV